MRVKLAENPNFNINYIFPDKKDNDMITSKDIIDFLKFSIYNRNMLYI